MRHARACLGSDQSLTPPRPHRPPAYPDPGALPKVVQDLDFDFADLAAAHKQVRLDPPLPSPRGPRQQGNPPAASSSPTTAAPRQGEVRGRGGAGCGEDGQQVVVAAAGLPSQVERGPHGVSTATKCAVQHEINRKRSPVSMRTPAGSESATLASPAPYRRPPPCLPARHGPGRPGVPLESWPLLSRGVARRSAAPWAPKHVRTSCVLGLGARALRALPAPPGTGSASGGILFPLTAFLIRR